jgi:hypothetical protein
VRVSHNVSGHKDLQTTVVYTARLEPGRPWRPQLVDGLRAVLYRLYKPQTLEAANGDMLWSRKNLAAEP